LLLKLFEGVFGALMFGLGALTFGLGALTFGLGALTFGLDALVQFQEGDERFAVGS
jgi:hypothetical protein